MLSYPDPHPPYVTREPYQSLYKPELMPIPETFTDKQNELNTGRPIKNKEIFQKKKASYCSMIKLIDDNVGKIIKALKKRNILSNTLIVFTTDHGDYMGEHGLMGKMKMHEAAYHIPMIIHYPNRITLPRQQDFMWSTIDFAPTLLDLLNIKTKTKFEGISHASKLLGKADRAKSDNPIYLEETNFSNGKFTKIRLGIISNDFWYVQEHGKPKYLYDRNQDQLQKRNLANLPEYETRMSELDKEVNSHHSSSKNFMKKIVSRLPRFTRS